MRKRNSILYNEPTSYVGGIPQYSDDNPRWRNGYLHYWGQISTTQYDQQNNIYIIHSIMGIVQDKRTGQIHQIFPVDIKFVNKK